MAPKPICKIEGCGKPVLRRGWCGPHYGRWSRYGDPLAGRTFQGEPERFFREVVLPYTGDDCLLWPFTSGRGYGQMVRDGRKQIVSRLVCEEVNGPPPTPKHEAAHSCGRGDKGCCTPRHLSWASKDENEMDKRGHGTTNRGERQGRSKLTEADVREIRASIGTTTQTSLAERFAVSLTTIGRILSRKTWSFVD